MKKNILSTAAFAAFVALAVTSCNKQQPQVEAKSNSQTAPSEMKIAYVEVDASRPRGFKPVCRSRTPIFRDYSNVWVMSFRLRQKNTIRLCGIPSNTSLLYIIKIRNTA